VSVVCGLLLLIVMPSPERRTSEKRGIATQSAWFPLLVLVTLLGLAAASGAAIPTAERLLSDETLVVITAPDWAKLSAIYRRSAYGQFWSDPAMKPLKDRFISRWQEELVKPLERELGVSLDTYGELPQGQLTLALTQDSSPGKAEQSPGFLLLLDTRDKSPLLKTNLAALRKQWVAAGKTIRTEKLRDVEFSIFPISSNNLPKTLRKFFPQPYEFQAPPGEVGSKKASPGSDVAPGNVDLLLDTITGLAFSGNEVVVGQLDSLLIAGNSLKAVEQVVIRLTGGGLPALGDAAAYQANHQALFRDAPLYGWVNVKAFFDAASRKPAGKPEGDAPDPFDVIPPEKILTATGLAGVRTLAFSLEPSNEGLRFQLSIGVPDTSRQGFIKILAGEAKETTPPPFIPSDAASFQRWRLDGQKTWATLEKMLTDASSQSVGTLNWILDTAGARAKEKDPAFDLKKMLVGNLGDDVISYEKSPSGDNPAQLRSLPYLLLLGSPNPEQLVAALKALFLIFPQGDTLAEREFLGRKICSVPLPPFNLLLSAAAKPSPARTLHFAASGGYVALSTDATFLEEYLRSSQGPVKALREKPGLAEAAEKVGGTGTCLFGYENEVETLRATFDAMKKDPGSAANADSLGLFPGLPRLAGAERHFKGWMDYSLAPPFDKVAQYFCFTVYGGSASVDGLTFKFFAPTPPALRGSSSPQPAKQP
jgi:hypothetical protein